MQLIDTIDNGRLNGNSKTYGNDGDDVMIHDNNKLCWEVDYENNQGSKKKLLINKCNDKNELQKFTIGILLLLLLLYFLYFF